MKTDPQLDYWKFETFYSTIYRKKKNKHSKNLKKQNQPELISMTFTEYSTQNSEIALLSSIHGIFIKKAYRRGHKIILNKI